MPSTARRAFAVVATAGLIGLTTATGATAAPDVELSFTPTSGPAGTTIRVTGQCPDGYAEAAGVFIGREDGEEAMNDAEAEVAEDGSFTAEIIVRTTSGEPAPKAGDELLVVGLCLAYGDDDVAWGEASRTFSVTAGSTGSGGGDPEPGTDGPAMPGSGDSDGPAAENAPVADVEVKGAALENAAGELPRTGGANWQIAVAGGAMVAGGGALLVAARRRQVGQQA